MLQLQNAIAYANVLTRPVTGLVSSYRRTIARLLLAASALCVPLVLFPRLIEPTGSAAFALLWFLLFIPVFSKVFGLELFAAFAGLRKELGILMGMLAVAHSAIYFFHPVGNPSFWERAFWVGQDGATYLAFGFAATAFTFLLLITSNAASVKLMGYRNWKLLHRTAYAVLVFTVLHVVVLEYAKHGKMEFWPLLVLMAFFIGKTLEWKGVTFAKKRA